MRFALIFFSAASMLAPLGLVAGMTPAGDGVAVVFAPWTSFDEALVSVARSGGRYVRPGAFDFIAIATFEDPAFTSSVRRQGAWALLDPQVLGGCLSERI